MGSSQGRGLISGPGRGSRSGEGSRFGGQCCGRLGGPRSGVKVRVMIGGHKVGVNVRGHG